MTTKMVHAVKDSVAVFRCDIQAFPFSHVHWSFMNHSNHPYNMTVVVERQKKAAVIDTVADDLTSGKYHSTLTVGRVVQGVW